MGVKAIILAAGSGIRTNLNINKLLYNINGKPVIAYTLESFQNNKKIYEIVLVVKKQEKKDFERIVKEYNLNKVKQIVIGGVTRQDSVYNGIKALDAEPNDIILIHNGSNIFLKQDEISEVIKAANEYGASVLGFPAKDTIKKHRNEFVVKTVSRDDLWHVQTPQAIKYGIAKQAFEEAYKDGFYGTDDVSLVERIGKKVKLVRCSYQNFKITTKEDLELAEAILLKKMDINYSIGIGQDSHRFTNHKKTLILGGVVFEGIGLEGNSDSDVVLHALCNALASSFGKGSIATYSDRMCLEQGIIDSREYVKVAHRFVKGAGYRVNNVSIAIEAKKPRIEEHIPKMQKVIAKLLDIKEKDVGITATSGEGLTDFGRGLGIQAFAIVSLKK